MEPPDAAHSLAIGMRRERIDPPPTDNGRVQAHKMNLKP
jgi:hypothetical protein